MCNALSSGIFCRWQPTKSDANCNKFSDFVPKSFPCQRLSQTLSDVGTRVGSADESHNLPALSAEELRLLFLLGLGSFSRRSTCDRLERPINDCPSTRSFGSMKNRRWLFLPT